MQTHFFSAGGVSYLAGANDFIKDLGVIPSKKARELGSELIRNRGELTLSVDFRNFWWQRWKELQAMSPILAKKVKEEATRKNEDEFTELALTQLLRRVDTQDIVQGIIAEHWDDVVKPMLGLGGE